MVTPLPTMAYGNWYVTLPRRPPKPAGLFFPANSAGFISGSPSRLWSLSELPQRLVRGAPREALRSAESLRPELRRIPL
jgi:hypothetical protein